MHLSNKIILIGMPGSGKSTLGIQLAKKLGLEFFDLDQLIKEKTGNTITFLFDKYGEDYFRNAESEILTNFITNKSHYVLAAGGGTPCYNDNIKIMNELASTIYLNVDVEEIIIRLSNNPTTNRPLLRAENLEQKVKNTLNDRKVFYELAKYQINGNQINADAVVSLLEKETNSK